jgi:hypothetical protein
MNNRLHAPPALPTTKNHVILSVGGSMRPSAVLYAYENRKICCPCQSSTPVASSPYASHYTYWAISTTIPVGWWKLASSEVAGSFVRWNMQCEYRSETNSELFLSRSNLITQFSSILTCRAHQGLSLSDADADTALRKLLYDSARLMEKWFKLASEQRAKNISYP